MIQTGRRRLSYAVNGEVVIENGAANGRLPRAGTAADALERLEFKVQSSMFKVRKEAN